MYEFSEAFNGFLENLNNFDATYNNFNYSLNNFAIFLKNKVDTIYIKRFKQVDPFYIDTPIFDTNSNFILDAETQITILGVHPSCKDDDPAELKKIYLNELVKLDDMQRKLVLYKGRMYNFRYIHMENVKDDNVNNPNIKDCLNNLQERSDRWLHIWRKYQATIRYKHEEIEA
jgi:hypothetical protein